MRFPVLLAALLLGLFVESHLISCLKDFHPTIHLRAGSPKPSDLLSRYGHNGTWRRYLLLRRFALDPVTASAFRVAFELAFVCAWLRCLAMSVFLLAVFWELFIALRH